MNNMPSPPTEKGGIREVVRWAERMSGQAQAEFERLDALTKENAVKKPCPVSGTLSGTNVADVVTTPTGAAKRDVTDLRIYNGDTVARTFDLHLHKAGADPVLLDESASIAAGSAWTPIVSGGQRWTLEAGDKITITAGEGTTTNEPTYIGRYEDHA